MYTSVTCHVETACVYLQDIVNTMQLCTAINSVVIQSYSVQTVRMLRQCLHMLEFWAAHSGALIGYCLSFSLLHGKADITTCCRRLNAQCAVKCFVLYLGATALSCVPTLSLPPFLRPLFCLPLNPSPLCLPTPHPSSPCLLGSGTTACSWCLYLEPVLRV